MTTKRRPRGTHLRATPALLTVLVLVLVVLAAGFTGRFTAEPVTEPPVGAVAEQSTTAPTPLMTWPAEPVPDDERLVIGGDVAVGALLILLVAGLALLVRFLLRIRRRSVERDDVLEHTDLQQTVMLAPAEDALPAWTGDAERRLATDADTSDAVIRCWLAFEGLAATAGITRTPVQTSSDFAGTAAAALDLPPEPLAALNRLYQQARFGQAGASGTQTAGNAARHLGPDDRLLAQASVRALSTAVAARPGTPR